MQLFELRHMSRLHYNIEIGIKFESTDTGHPFLKRNANFRLSKKAADAPMDAISKS